LTESDTDEASSTTTETPDAGTLRDISVEATQVTPTQSLMHLPIVSADPVAILIDNTALKTPLPPADQVPDIPDADDDALDASWEKVEIVDKSNPRSKMETKEKAKEEPVPTPPEPSEQVQADGQPREPTPEKDELMIPPRVPPKDSEKVEKAMSEPGWLEDFLGKNRRKDKGKSKSVVSSTSTTEPFVRPGPSPLGRSGTSTPVKEKPKPGELPTSLERIFAVGPMETTAAEETREERRDLERSPPPTFSQIYPDSPLDNLPVESSADRKDPATGEKEINSRPDDLLGEFSAGREDPAAGEKDSPPDNLLGESSAVWRDTVVGDKDTPTFTEGDNLPKPAATEADPAVTDPTTTEPGPLTTTSTVEAEPDPESESDGETSKILDAPPSQRLSSLLEFRKQIVALKKKLSKQKKDPSKSEEATQTERQIRKLEKKVDKISYANFNPEEDTDAIDLGTLQGKMAVEKVEERLYRLMSSASPHTHLEVTTLKGLKARPLKMMLTSKLKDYGFESAEDPNNGRIMRVTIPSKAKSTDS
jgi:hypothetical protein